LEKDLTPIFLVEAEKSLEAGNFDRAIELCKRGIEYFPDYYLGYVILIESYESVGNYEEADKIYQEACVKFATNLFFKQIARRRDKYGTLINSKNREPNELISDSISAIQIENPPAIEKDFLNIPEFSEYKDIILEELSANDIDLIPGLNFLPFKIPNHNQKITDLQLFYDHISKDIPNIEIYLDKPIENNEVEHNFAKGPLEVDENVSEFNLPNIIPTETLAEIYVRQNKISEAIDIYEQLCEINPEKSTHYNEQIAKLKH